MMPLISVIIPVYNVEKYLCKCIDSTLAQTYTNIEIMLIDDGSTDNSGKICDEYVLKDARIKVIHQPNAGVSAARNAGLDLAKGEYVCFVDADDTVKEEYIYSLFSPIGNKRCDIAMCGYSIVSYSMESMAGQVKKNIKGNIRKCFGEIYINGGGGPLISPALKIFNKSILERFNIRFDVKINFGEDRLFALQYYKHVDSFCFIRECLYRYFHHGAGSATEIYTKKRALDEIYVLQQELQWMIDSKTKYTAETIIMMAFQVVNSLTKALCINTQCTIYGKYKNYKDLMDNIRVLLQGIDGKCSMKHKILKISIKKRWFLPSFCYYYVVFNMHGVLNRE